jgi:hypothetical protein
MVVHLHSKIANYGIFGRLGGLGMEVFGLIHGHMVHFVVIWHISEPHGIFYGELA